MTGQKRNPRRKPKRGERKVQDAPTTIANSPPPKYGIVLHQEISNVCDAHQPLPIPLVPEPLVSLPEEPNPKTSVDPIPQNRQTMPSLSRSTTIRRLFHEEAFNDEPPDAYPSLDNRNTPHTLASPDIPLATPSLLDPPRTPHFDKSGGAHNPFFKRFGPSPPDKATLYHLNIRTCTPSPTQALEEPNPDQPPATADEEDRDSEKNPPTTVKKEECLQHRPSPSLEGPGYLKPGFSESSTQTSISFRVEESTKIAPMKTYRHAYMCFNEHVNTDEDDDEDYSRSLAGLPRILQREPAYSLSGWDLHYAQPSDKSTSVTFDRPCSIPRGEPTGLHLKNNHSFGKPGHSGALDPIPMEYTVESRLVQTNNSVRGVSSTLGAKSPTSYNKPPQRQHVPQDAPDSVSFDRPCSIPRGEPTGLLMKNNHSFGKSGHSGALDPIPVKYTVKSRLVQTNQSVRDANSTVRVKHPASYMAPQRKSVATSDRVVDPRGGTHRDESSVKAAQLWADHMQRLHMLEVAQRFGGLALGEVQCVDSDAGDSVEDDYAENDDPYGECDYDDDCYFYDDHHDFACDWS